MFDITAQRYNQIKRIVKVQQFKYDKENNQINYELESYSSLRKVCEEEMKGTIFLKMGQWAIIIKNIVDLLLKINQITYISALSLDNIFVNMGKDENMLNVKFSSYHELQSFSYSQNIDLLLRIVQYIFLSHKDALKKTLKDENINKLSRKIEWVTMYSNQILDILKSQRHHSEILLFVKNNVKNGTLLHKLFIDEGFIRDIQGKDAIGQKSKPVYCSFQQEYIEKKTYQQDIPNEQSVVYQLYEQSQVQQQQDTSQEQYTESQYSQKSRAIEPELYGYFQTGLKQIGIVHQDLIETLLSFISNYCKGYDRTQADILISIANTFVTYPDLYLDHWSNQLLPNNESSQKEVLKLKTTIRTSWEIMLQENIHEGTTKFLQQDEQQNSQTLLEWFDKIKPEVDSSLAILSQNQKITQMQQQGEQEDKNIY